MLQLVDRLVIAVPEVNTAIESCEDLFGSLVVDEIFDREGCARRVTLGLGASLLEIMEPRGPGPVLDFIEQRRTGVFGIGVAVAEPGQFANSLNAKGMVLYPQSPRRFVVFPDDCRGIGLVINKLRIHPPVGLVRGISRVTFAVVNLTDIFSYYCWLLDLDSTQVEVCTAGDQAIAWFNTPSANLISSLEWIASGSKTSNGDRSAGYNGTDVCRITVESDRLPEIRNRAVQNGYQWRESNAGGMLYLPELNRLTLNVTSSEIPQQRAVQHRALMG